MEVSRSEYGSDITKLFSTVVENDYCIGCGACASVRDSPIKIRLDEFGKYRPFLDSFTTDEHRNFKVQMLCPFSNESANEDELGKNLYSAHGKYDEHLGYVVATYAGYVLEGDFRERGSSGGIGSWILNELLNNKLVDKIVHVRPKSPSNGDNTLFKYMISDTIEEVKSGSRSHYYPTEMSEAITIIRNNPGRYAIVGIPCFIKAVRLLMKQDDIIAKRIKYCIGLVCGYLPSTKFAELFAWQCGIKPNNLTSINFRRKVSGQPANRYSVEVTGVRDDEVVTEAIPFGYSWGNGFLKHNACDFCDDVVAETADITIGDAWLPRYVHDSKGTSIIIVRDASLHETVRQASKEGRIHLEAISLEDVIESQSPGFRHRRDGLAYRLYLKDKAGDWRPKKRVTPKAYRYRYLFRKIHEYRPKISKESHHAFQEAVAVGDFSVFQKRMAPLLRKYRIVRSTSLVMARVKRYIGV